MANDTRTPAELVKQHEKLGKVRRELVRQGLLNGDATADEVIACLRKSIPAEMFT